MLSKAFLTSVSLCVIFSMSASAVTFTVKPGTLLQSASIGKEMGAITPYFGLDVAGISIGVEMEEHEEHSVSYGGGYEDHRWVYHSKTKLDGSALLIVPHIGARYHFRQGGDVRPYLFGEFFKCFASVSVDGSDSWSESYYSDGELQSTDSGVDRIDAGEAEDLAKDILGFYGLNLGFGASYYFSDNFSLGGEYGFRFIMTSAETKGSDHDDWGDGDGWHERWTAEVNAAFRISYAALTLSFHF